MGLKHRDRTRASILCCFCLFFPHLNIQNTCWLWVPATLKTHQKVWFSPIYLWIILSESCFYCKKTPNLIKKLFLCFESRPRVGPINSQHINFKWGNIFAGICTILVLSIWFKESLVAHWSFWGLDIKKCRNQNALAYCFFPTENSRWVRTSRHRGW